MCVHAYLYVCVQSCVYVRVVWVRASMNVSVHVHTCMYVRVYMYVCTYMYVCAVCAYVCICMYIRCVIGVCLLYTGTQYTCME